MAERIRLVVSDDSLGLPKALQNNLPNTQQCCITHKVQGLF
ncbi:transposase [Leptolyngbyaceae cyanobacterium UHCC 1019]